ncbi:uncharacterized protein [Cardiocondyla obscurior]|uniref:uncharacterized protein n=1 Tax=Cardiocondyla obscurior TaxID=286306 RepID=UPI00396582CA
MRKDLEILRRKEKEWREEREALIGKVKELERKMEKEKREYEEVRYKIERLERKNEEMEKRERRKNIIVKGVKNTEDKKKMEGEIKEIIRKLGVEIKVEEIRKLREGSDRKGGIILVKMENEMEKEKMMKNKEKLKGTKVWIQEDRT